MLTSKTDVPLPLDGLRVIDASVAADSITVTSLLADAGADVILMDSSHNPHASHAVGPVVNGVNLLWKVIGRNKRWVRVDLDNDAGLIERLLERADVLVVDRRTAFGRPVDELQARHPHLVIVATTAFGLVGPSAGRAGDGRAAEAFGGQVFASGEPDRPPLHSGFPIGAAAIATLGSVATIAALLERARSGEDRGQLVDVAGYECVLRYMEFLPIFFHLTGFLNERAGNGSSYQVPVATWQTSDGFWVTFTGNTNDIVHRLYRAIGRPMWSDDARFATNEARVANRAVVEPSLAERVATMSRAELVAACEREGAPIGVVLTFADIAEDENYVARGSIERLVDLELGKVAVPRSVPRFDGVTTTPSTLGSLEPLPPDLMDALWSAPRVAPRCGTPQQDRSRGPLAGLRVMDIGQILAGPFAATLLADLGADVIKVENPERGDDFRRQAPLLRDVSMWWKASARNKRSVSLNLKDSSDRALFVALAQQADIVTANFVPGSLERLGLDHAMLLEVNPGIVMACVSGYGQDGPYRARRAFGRNAEAYGGLAAVTGYADTAPMPTGFPVADGFSASLAAFGALCAIYARDHGGGHGGRLVDVALYETIIRMLEVYVLMHSVTGDEPAPSSYGTAAGEAFMVARSSDGRWMSASRWDKGPVHFDAAAPSGTSPDGSREATLAEMEAYMAGHTGDELADQGHHDGFDLIEVTSIDDLVQSAHVRARSSLIELDDDELGELSLVGVVPRFDRTPGHVHHASPRLDEHRGQILSDWLGTGRPTAEDLGREWT